jgi:hypothetical protein
MSGEKKTNFTGKSINIYCQIMFETVKNKNLYQSYQSPPPFNMKHKIVLFQKIEVWIERLSVQMFDQC